MQLGFPVFYLSENETSRGLANNNTVYMYIYDIL